MLREERQAKILEIISTQEIETQEELCAALNEINFSVTQATVSRDIKQLRLFKINGEKKKRKYAYLDEHKNLSDGLPVKLRRLFRECVVSICLAQNIVVIKTISGNASNAGLVLDSLNYKEVIGSVAGDDTLFSACATNEDAKLVAEKLNEIIK